MIVTMKKAYIDVGFQTLLDQPKVASLDDVLILNDNFDHPIHLEPTVRDVFRNKTNKMVSTVTILVCVGGKIELSNNFTDYTLCRNDAIINRSGTLGQFYGMSDDASFFLLAINSNFFFPMLLSGDSSEMLNLTVTHPTCHLSDHAAESALQLYSTLKTILNQEDRPLYVREIARGLTEGITFHIISSLVGEVKTSDRQYQKKPYNQDLYKRFLHLVEENFTKKRNIQFYADKLCLSPKYLSQLIYKESGSYASEHINRFVIAEAKALLKSGQYTVAQVCDKLHFVSQSYFTRYFRKATGMNPSEMLQS